MSLQLVSVSVDLDQFLQLQDWAQGCRRPIAILWVRRCSIVCCFRASKQELVWLILSDIVAV